MTNVYVPFGLTPDGSVVTVEEVVRGLNCQCVCPACGTSLVAAKGEIYRHHFRHLAESSCQGFSETALHQYAKKLICERKQLRLPYGLTADGNSFVTLSEAQPEVRWNGRVPDVLAKSGEVELAIEILVGHKVPNDKAEHYNGHKMTAVEIDLSEWRSVVASEDDWASAILYSAPRIYLSVPPWHRLERKKPNDPPSLQDLVTLHGGYDRIPEEAWAEFNREMAEWKAAVKYGDFWLTP